MYHPTSDMEWKWSVIAGTETETILISMSDAMRASDMDKRMSWNFLPVGYCDSSSAVEVFVASSISSCSCGLLSSVLVRLESALGAASFVEETLGVSVNVCDILARRECDSRSHLIVDNELIYINYVALNASISNVRIDVKGDHYHAVLRCDNSSTPKSDILDDDEKNRSTRNSVTHSGQSSNISVAAI